MRELQREVAARLASTPGPNPAALAKGTDKGGESVIPVVVTGYEIHLRVVFVKPRQRRLVWTDKTVLVLVDSTNGIDLVTAKNHYMRPGQLFAVHDQLFLRG